ncbi:hypothetical protein BVY02_00405 [bacterium J17]|nr:hypothetical protein BVY02_00405 [bacterium J17]
MGDKINEEAEGSRGGGGRGGGGKKGQSKEGGGGERGGERVGDWEGRGCCECGSIDGCIERGVWWGGGGGGVVGGGGGGGGGRFPGFTRPSASDFYQTLAKKGFPNGSRESTLNCMAYEVYIFEISKSPGS